MPALTYASPALPAEKLLYLWQIPTPSPSSVFIRENAIIFNIESLRMIITKDEVSASSWLPLGVCSGPVVAQKRGVHTASVAVPCCSPQARCMVMWP